MWQQCDCKWTACDNIAGGYLLGHSGLWKIILGIVSFNCEISYNYLLTIQVFRAGCTPGYDWPSWLPCHTVDSCSWLAVDQEPHPPQSHVSGAAVQLSHAPVCMYRKDCPFPSALVKIHAIGDYSDLKFLQISLQASLRLMGSTTPTNLVSSGELQKTPSVLPQDHL